MTTPAPTAVALAAQPAASTAKVEVPVAKAPVVNLVAKAPAAKPAEGGQPSTAGKPDASSPPPGDAPPPGQAHAAGAKPEAHEALLAAEFAEDDPLWRGGHKNLRPYDKILAVLPDDGKKLVANLRADYTRKTQAHARETADLRAQLQTATEELATERTRFERIASPEFQAHLDKISADAKGADPLTPEGRKLIEEARAVEFFNRMMAPLREEVAAQSRKAALTAFVAKNPDFGTDKTIQKGVRKILSERPGISLQDAYDLFKYRTSASDAEKLRAAKAKSDEEARRVLSLTGSTGLTSTRGADRPKFGGNALKAMEWVKARGE